MSPSRPQFRCRTILPPLLLAALAGSLPGQEGSWSPTPGTPAGDPVLPAPPGAGRTWVLLANTANDFHIYEVSPAEIDLFNYELGLPFGNPPDLARLLQDRDGFPAMPLLAYETLRFQRGIPDGRITLMLFHDDEPGNSLCERPIGGGNDNDVLGDEWVDWGLPLWPRNALWGPDGSPATADDPLCDYETLTVGQGAAPVTKDNLQAAIQDLASRVFPSDKVFLYLVDHGADADSLNPAALYFEAGEATPGDPADDKVTADEFDGWLDAAFAGIHRPGLLVLMADCCYAEQFLAPSLVLEGNGENRRVMVASAAADQLSWYHLESMAYNINPVFYPGFGPVAGVPAGSVFFWPFWNYISLGYPVQKAYDRAVNFAPAFFPGPVLDLQEPVLVDRRRAESYEGETRASDTSERWYDIEWRPQGDYALVAGEDGKLYQYRWNPGLNGTEGDYELVLLHSGEGRILKQVVWSPDGTFALAVGWGGLVLHVDHVPAPGLPVVTVVNPDPSFAATNWGGCAAALPWGELAADGWDFVMVGNLGAIALYDWDPATGTRLQVPAGIQGSSSDWFLGCDVNPLGQHQDPAYPCDFTRSSDEVLVVGFHGAWVYRYTNGWRDPNCGPPTTILEETLTRVLDRQGTILQRVKWQPEQADWALAVGHDGTYGVLALLDAGDGWTIQQVVETDDLKDVDFKPDRAYVLCGGADRTWVRVPGQALHRYAVLRQDGQRDITGLDWRPTNSQATAAAVYPSIGIGFVLGSIEEFYQAVDF